MLIWLRIDNRKTRIVFYSMHMPDSLMLLCKLALRAQTCTRIRWQYACHDESYTNVLFIIDLNRLNNSEQPGRFFIDINMRFTNIKQHHANDKDKHTVASFDHRQ